MLRKRKFNIFLVIGIVYITLYVTLAYSWVGDYPTDCGEPLGSHMPFTMFFLLFPLFLLGYFGGLNP